MIQISNDHYAWPWQITDIHYEQDRYAQPDGWYVYLKDATHSRIHITFADKDRIIAATQLVGGDET